MCNALRKSRHISAKTSRIVRETLSGYTRNSMTSMSRIKATVRHYLSVLGTYLHTDMVYVAKSTFWLNANFVISGFLSFAISIAFAHLLPKEAYGTYQFVLSLASFVTAFTLTGMNVAIIRAVSRGYEGGFVPSIRMQLKWSVGA